MGGDTETQRHRERTRVLVVDRLPLFADAMARGLSVAGYAVLASTLHSRAAIEAAGDWRPEVVIVHVGVRGEESVSTIRSLRRRMPAASIVAVLDAAEDARCAPSSFGDVAASFRSTRPLREFLALLDRVCARREAGRALAGARPGADSPQPEPVSDRLAYRERQVAELVAIGQTNRQIALALCLSEHTIRHYVEHIMDKLSVHRRIEIATIIAAERAVQERDVRPYR